MKIYCAGPIAGKSYTEATDWYFKLASAIQFSDIQLITPMRGKSFLQNEENLNHTYAHVLASSKGITTRDRWDVMRCDAVCANLTNDQAISIGTMIELGWADAFKKPVIMICNENSIYDLHGMVSEIAGFKVRTLEEAAEVIMYLSSQAMR